MKMPEEVYQHRAALIAEYGFSPNDVTADGVSDEGFLVVGEFPERGTPRYAYDAIPLTFIPWKTEDRQRALDAMRLDWEETVGPEAAEQLRRLAAKIGS